MKTLRKFFIAMNNENLHECDLYARVKRSSQLHHILCGTLLINSRVCKEEKIHIVKRARPVLSSGKEEIVHRFETKYFLLKKHSNKECFDN